MIPIIINLINSLESFNNIYKEDFDNNRTIISDLEEILIQQIEIDYNNIAEVLEKVKKNIYIGLKNYWIILNECDLIAILLDPRYKNFDFISNNSIKEKIYYTLQIEYNQLKLKISQQQNILSSLSSSTTTTST